MKVALVMILLLSSLASAATDCSKVETSFLDKQACYNKLAKDSGDHKDCFSAPAVTACIVNLAVETTDPAPILTLTEGEGPSIYTAKDRDRLLQQYVTMSMDMDSLDLIKDPKIHDETLILSLPIIYANFGLVPTVGYCDEIKGGYEFDPRYGNTVEEDEADMLNNCLAYSAALRQHRDGGDECHGNWTKKTVDLYGRWRKDAIDDCVNLSKYLSKGIQELLGASWVLVDTKINPAGAPTTFVVGETPGYYSSPRFDGKWAKYTVSPTSLGMSERDVDHGFENYKTSFTAALTGPPPILKEGENITLSAHLSGSGTSTEQYAGGCSSAIRFEYRVDGASIKGNTKGTICMDFKEQTLDSHFIVPRATRRNLTVDAFLWNCGACNVRWIYMRALDVMIPPDPIDIDDSNIPSDFIADLDEPADAGAEEPAAKGGGIVSTVKGVLSGIKGAASSAISRIRGLFGI